ncbi:MAG TPA: trigger factor [Longimicrobium sp.]|nr:trigger factor [Longimicrobium sp.]
MAESTTTQNQLTVTVEQPSSFARHLSISVPPERVERIRKSVAQQITRNVRLPGFRKGHVPQSLMDKQFGPAIQQETVDRVIQETYPEALQQENIRPIAQGTVKDVHYHEGGELHYHVEVEVQPEITLARTSGFIVPAQNAEVGDTEVDALLERLRTERAELAAVEDRTPQAGDEVQVRITPAAAAEGDDAPEAEEFKFVLGEGQAIPAIEDAIQTLSPGEEKEFDITFPEDYGDADQAGTTQRLRIGVVELKERRFPELDDEFARTVTNGETETIAALRERVRGDMQTEARQRADQAYRDALLGEIAEANHVEVPESMVQNYLEYMTGGMTGGAQGGKRAPRTPEQEERFSQFREMLRPQAEATLKRMLVVETLADREGLRATQDDVDARVEQLAEQHGQGLSDVWLQLEKSGQLQQIEADITETKVLEWLRQHNTAG